MMKDHHFNKQIVIDIPNSVKIIGKCQRRIGNGQFGDVYQVKCNDSKLYAAKVINCRDDKEECEKIIQREISILSLVKHPTMIKFYGYSKTDFNGAYNITILMKLAKNGSILNIIESIQNSLGPHDYTLIKKQIILVGISRGMKYLHNRNIIHRDLKPGNILLDKNFYPHISDFGLSKILGCGHSYTQSQFGGTLTYIAPEIIQTEKYGKKADVYSFGIMMFEILTDEFAYPDVVKGEITNFEFNTKVVNENKRPKIEKKT